MSALIGVNGGQEAYKYCRKLPKSDHCMSMLIKMDAI